MPPLKDLGDFAKGGCVLVMLKFSLVAALVISIAGCSGWNDDRGKGDAPVHQVPDRTVTVYPNGNEFPNISAFCIGKHGVYTSRRNIPFVVIVNDDNCSNGTFVPDKKGQ